MSRRMRRRAQVERAEVRCKVRAEASARARESLRLSEAQGREGRESSSWLTGQCDLQRKGGGDERKLASAAGETRAVRCKREKPTHRLANLDELALLDVELEVARRLEDHDDGAAELETAHLVTGVQRLALEQGRRLRVAGLDVGPGRVRADPVVGAEGLRERGAVSRGLKLRLDRSSCD